MNKPANVIKVLEVVNLSAVFFRITRKAILELDGMMLNKTSGFFQLDDVSKIFKKNT